MYDARAEAPPASSEPAARASGSAPGPRRGGRRVNVSRYLGRRLEEGERRRTGPATIALIAITLALLAFWLADVRRFWDAAEPARVERG